MVGVFCLWLAFFFVNLHVCVNYTHYDLRFFICGWRFFFANLYECVNYTHYDCRFLFVVGVFSCVLLLLSDCLWNVYIACVVYCMCWLVAVYLGISKSLRDSRPIADVCLMLMDCFDFLLMDIYIYIHMYSYIYIHIYIYICLHTYYNRRDVRYKT